MPQDIYSKAGADAATSAAINALGLGTAAFADAADFEAAGVASVVIAASNSTTEAKAAADVVCTGTADQNAINAAIVGLPASGGKILLRAGQYNLTGPVVIDRDYVDIEGEAHPMWGGYVGGYPNAGTEGTGGAKLKIASAGGISAIEFRNAADSGTGADTYRHRAVRVASLYLYGYSYTGTGIRTNYSRSAGAGSDAFIIEDLMIQKFQHGMNVHFDACTLRGNDIQDCSGDAITHSGHFGIITGNLIYDNGGRGIVDSALMSPIITSNTIGDCAGGGIASTGPSAVITGNVVQGVLGTAMLKSTGAGASITGNTLDNTNGGVGASATIHGIEATGAGPSITGNTINTTPTSSGWAILASGVGGAVTGNAIRGQWNGGSASTVLTVSASTATGLNGGDDGLEAGATTTTTTTAATTTTTTTEGGSTTTTTTTASALPTVTTATLLDHYKADGITPQADGTALSQWTSALGTPAVPNTTSPLYIASSVNGLPAVRFNGTTDALKHATIPALANQPITYFVVAKQAAAVGTPRALVNVSTPGQEAALFVDSTQHLGAYAGAIATGATFTTTTAHVLEGFISGASTLLVVDGTSSSTLNAGGQQQRGAGIVLGANGPMSAEFWNGDIAEVIIYQGNMSAGDRSAVRQYLGTKYGITVA